MLGVGLLLGLTGCEFPKFGADPATPGAEVSDDRLVGLFVTTTDLLFLEPGGPTPTVRDRFEADRVEIPGNGGPGSDPVGYDYQFPGLPGYRLMLVSEPAGSHTTYTQADDALYDVHSGEVDDENGSTTFTVEGTVGVYPGHDILLNTYPIYQRSDDSVYLLVGGGVVFPIAAGAAYQDHAFASSLDKTLTITVDGKSTSEKHVAIVNVSIVAITESVAVAYMDAQSNRLDRREYKADALPATLVPPAGTAYLVVESLSHDQSGKVHIDRRVYADTDENVRVFHAQPDGICTNTQIPIGWVR